MEESEGASVHTGLPTNDHRAAEGGGERVDGGMRRSHQPLAFTHHGGMKKTCFQVGEGGGGR